jgi:hypothetical protein
VTADKANIANITLRMSDLLRVTLNPRRLSFKTPRSRECSEAVCYSTF